MLRPVALQSDSLERVPEASAATVTRRVCSVATEVHHQFLGQDLHLLDDGAFHGAPYRLLLLCQITRFVVNQGRLTESDHF